MRFNYWSCSNFADKIRGVKKIQFGTHDEWRQWEMKAKEFSSFRYWLAEEVLNKIQDFIMFPIDLMHKVKYKINNRFFVKTHALTSNMSRWDWHEFDTRIFKCLFDEMVNFVEVDLAWFYYDKKIDKFYKFGVNSRNVWGIQSWRSSEYGIKSLEWQSTLTNDDVPSSQALNAKELLSLYNWYKFEYPKRQDPYEVYKQPDELLDKLLDDLLSNSRTPEQREETASWSRKISELEEQYYNEDTEMLIRLIKIRNSLWV